VNIDFSTREPHAKRRALRLIRLGTAGALQDDISLDSMVLSDLAIGLDNNIHFYEGAEAAGVKFNQSLGNEMACPAGILPYGVSASSALAALWQDHATFGTTLTLPGFYAAQGRHLRTHGCGAYDLSVLAACRHQGRPILNLEMETAPLYALGRLLGHHCLSLSVILAQRAEGAFSRAPREAVDRMIELSLEVLCADHAARR
jgi:uridine phosphorylase